MIENLLRQLAEDQAQLAAIGEKGGADLQRLEVEMQKLQQEIQATSQERTQVDIERNTWDDAIQTADEKRNEVQISIAERMRDAQNLQESVNAALERAEEYRRQGEEQKRRCV